MHLGVISFCDRVAYNIKSNEVKTDILEEIDKKYNVKIIQKHFFRLTEESVTHIIATPHVVSIRSNGNPYFLYFTKYDDKEIIYFIDKKIHPTYQLPRIIIVKGLFDENLFNGTLIDGEMVCCYNKKWVFLISDIIAYKGEHLIKFQLPERLTILNNMLDNEYTADNPMDICKYRIKPYYNLCVDTLETIQSFKFPFSVRGIYFWAYNFKYKPKLMNIDDTVIQTVSIKTKDNPDFALKPDNIKSVIKTDLPDIYKVKEDNKYLSIQTILQSHMLRNAFKDSNLNFTKSFKCEYNSEFDKWIPLSIA
jgi:hypothetical protein